MSSPPAILRSEKGMHVILSRMSCCFSVPGKAVWCCSTPASVASVLWPTAVDFLIVSSLCIVALLFRRVLSHKRKKKGSVLLHTDSQKCLYHKETAKQIKKQTNVNSWGREEVEEWKHCINASILPPFQQHEKDSLSKTGNSVSKRRVCSH